MMDGGTCAAQEPFALRVLGNSMEPEFNEGCIIIIEPIKPEMALSGMYVMAEQEGEYIFRQYLVKNERHYLVPLNNDYYDIEIPDKTVIKGIIVQRAGKRRKEAKHYTYKELFPQN